MAVIVAHVLRSASSSSQPTRAAAKIVLSTLMRDTDRAQNLGFTPLSLLGLGLVMAGTLLRWKCFQKMGSQFTAELTIHKDHKLITTGPYSFVRHPAIQVAWLCILASSAGIVAADRG